MTKRIARAGAALLLAALWGAPGSAQAGNTFASPFLAPTTNGYGQCQVTNLETRPVALTVELRDYFGFVVAPTFDDCNAAELASRASCSIVAPAGADVYCWINSNGRRIRGALAVYDVSTDDLVTVIPATR
jgi:hypothetical protein